MFPIKAKQTKTAWLLCSSPYWTQGKLYLITNLQEHLNKWRNEDTTMYVSHITVNEYLFIYLMSYLWLFSIVIQWKINSKNKKWWEMYLLLKVHVHNLRLNSKPNRQWSDISLINFIISLYKRGSLALLLHTCSMLFIYVAHCWKYTCYFI